ncbi:MAG: DoxX family membrane protein, partial [Actinomycetota bacterium]|nr:DoxX family membrane protein [Actinomycetota bacterium]
MINSSRSPRPAAIRWLLVVDQTAIEQVRRHSLIVLRLALGIVFLWFGALKIFDQTPVADAVASTLYFLEPRTAVLATGIVEMVIGMGLITGQAMRL